MQKPLLILLAVVSIGLGALCIAQWQQIQKQRARERSLLESLQAESQGLREQVARTAEAETRAVRLQREAQEFSSIVSNLRASEGTYRSNFAALAKGSSLPATDGSTNTASGSSGPFGKDMGEMLDHVLKDPQMRKMVRAQQKGMIEMMYGGLFKRLKLSPEEKTKLEDLLLDSQMRQVDTAKQLLSKDKDQGGEAAKTLEQARKEEEASLRELLGDSRYSEFEGYKKHLGDHMELGQLESKLEAEKLPLGENQSERLLALMREEKERVPPVLPSDPTLNASELKPLMTPENIEKQLQWTEAYNKRLLERAPEVLTHEQIQKFREFQEQQAAMQKLGLKMAAEMFGPKKP